MGPVVDAGVALGPHTRATTLLLNVQQATRGSELVRRLLQGQPDYLQGR